MLRRRAALLLVSVTSVVLTLVLLEVGLGVAHTIQGWMSPPPPAPYLPASAPIDDFWGSNPRSAVIHQASTIPGLGYEMAPNRELTAGNGITIKTNQFGMRDSEPFAPQTDSPCRIAVLGDSYTLGLGVREGETYAKVLERLLRQSPAAAQCRFEVLNFGVVGYSSSDEALVLRYRALQFDPHLVILGYVLNDPETDPYAQSLHRYYAERPWWRNFRLTRLPYEAELNWEIKRFGGGDYYFYLHAPGQSKWQSVVDAFDAIRDLTTQRNIKVMVVIFPEITRRFKGKPWADYPYTKIHQQVSDLALSRGFEVLDLRDAYSQHPSQDVVLPWTDDHPSVLGHAVAAQAIEAKLLTELAQFFQLEAQQSAAASH